MTSLDLRAQRAAAGIRASVAASPATPPIDFRGAARMRFMTQATMAVSAVAAVAAAFVIMGTVIQTPAPVPVAPAASTTTSSTLAPSTTDVPATTTAPTPAVPTSEVPPVPTETTTTTVVTTTTTHTTTTTTLAPDTTPPDFKILSPENNQVFQNKVVTFSGTTEIGAKVFAGRYEATVTGTGEWSIALTLSPGRNVATLIATDAAGNETSATVVVFLEATEPKPDRDWEFIAHRVNGSSSETPPFDVYWGTGKPGTVIQVLSEYGSKSTEIDTDGDWEVLVHFSTAPANIEFQVKVNDFEGSELTFGFIYFVE